jgi:hypothetical protein
MYKLSSQALGAIMLALQESLMNQSDIVPVLQGFDLELTADGLVVRNPPTIRVDNPTTTTDDVETSAK